MNDFNKENKNFDSHDKLERAQSYNLFNEDEKIEDSLKKYELIFNMIKDRYKHELERINHLDNKAGNSIGYISVILSLLIGVGTFDIIEKISKSNYYFIYFIGLILLIVSFLFSFHALKIRKLKVFPAVARLYMEYTKNNYSYSNVIAKSLTPIAKAIEEIAEKNEIKANNIIISFYFLIAGLITLAIYISIFVINEIVSNSI